LFLPSRNASGDREMSAAEQQERFVRIDTNALAEAFIAVDPGRETT